MPQKLKSIRPSRLPEGIQTGELPMPPNVPPPFGEVNSPYGLPRPLMMGGNMVDPTGRMLSRLRLGGPSRQMPMMPQSMMPGNIRRR